MADPELSELLSYKPALILGPRITTAASGIEALLQRAIDKSETHGFVVAVEMRTSAPHFFDALRIWNAQQAEIIERDYRNGLAALNPALDLGKIARINWSAVVSITQDFCLEQLIQTRLEKEAHSRTLTVISHPSTQVPARTLPVFRLLGDPSSTDSSKRVAISNADLAIRKQCWRDLLSQFSDAAKGATVFVVGIDETDPLLHDAMAALLSLNGPVPRKYVFLDAPNGLKSPILRSMLSTRAQTIQLQSSLLQFCQQAAEYTAIPVQVELGLDLPKQVEQIVAEYADVLAVPRITLPANFEPSQHMTELCDALFRPMSLDWRPFLADLDFIRDQSSEAKETASEAISLCGSRDVWPSLIVKGAAGVGKTTFLKRLALDLRRDSTLTLWIRRRPLRGLISVLKEFARKIKHSIGTDRTNAPRIALFCDDPIALDLDPAELLFAFESVGFPVLTVFGLRDSDDLTGSLPSWVSDRFPVHELQVRYDLSEAELDRLEDFLVKHRIAESKQSANQMVATVPGSSAKDILCSLWYLVPQTKFQLESSLENEYIRLGSPRVLIESLADSAGTSTDIARRAYEMVAVGSYFDLPIPVEVLVRALAAGSYEEWLSQTSAGKPLWGLLYDDYDESLETFSYRTRNVVVTDVLVKLLNQGVGHAGQFRVLKALVAACEFGGPLYQSFLTSLLVGRRDRLAKLLTGAEGLQLFNMAVSQSSTNQGLLLHHQAIWMRDKGESAAGAYKVLEKALAIVAQDTTQSERRENIHVSMAAAIADELANGDIDPQLALETVQSHLGEARQRGYFDPHVTHVFANTLHKIAKKSSGSPATAIESTCRALSEIERGMLAMGGTAKGLARNQRGIEMMVDLQRRIIAGFSEDELEAAAKSMLAKGSTLGVELQARFMLRDAVASSKGHKFNAVIELLDSALEQTPSGATNSQISLREIRSIAMIRWRLFTKRGPIDWSKLRNDIEILRQSPFYKSEAIWHYYHALCLFHLGDISGAMTEFGALKRSTHSYPGGGSMRNFFLGPEGAPRKLQGTVHRSHDRIYVSLSGMDLDVEAPEAPRTLRHGETVHCYLAFRFFGPRAFFGNPEEQDLNPPGDFDGDGNA